jgi:dihydroceramidase
MTTFKDKKGFWWPPTATLEWCERKYYVSWFVAEFWNSLSALLYVGLTAWHWHWHGRRMAWKFHVAYSMLVLVSLGSCLFHATLKYPMQLLDELPMLYGMSHGIFCLLPFAPVPYMLAMLGNVAFTCYYVVYRDAFWHQVMFAGIHAVLGFIFVVRCLQLALHKPTRLMAIRSLLLGTAGITMTLIGLGLWIYENNNCDELTHWKRALGHGYVLLELHAIWHLLSYLGCLYLQTAIMLIDATSVGMQTDIAFKLGFLPVLTAKSAKAKEQ